MKKKYILRGLMVAALATITSSCEKNFLDVNTSPNSPTSSTSALILPNAINVTATQVNGTLNVLGNLLSGNYGQAPDFLFYLPQETYALQPGTYDAVWTNLYANSLKNLQFIVNNATSTEKNYVAIAKIMQAYDFQVLVDLWGDVPFTDALKGTSVLTPKYDSAASVYDNILKLIDDGVATIDAAAIKPGANDIVFGGTTSTEMDNWKKFANTLKLRVLIHQSRVPGRAAQVTAGFATLAGASFLGAGQNAAANPGYFNQAGEFSPIYASIGFSATGATTSNYQATRATQFAVDFLSGTSNGVPAAVSVPAAGGATPITPSAGTGTADPRLALLYRTTPNVTTAYKGVIQGSTAATGNRSNDLSPVGPAILKTSANAGYATPAYLISAAESYFLQSEAVVRGYMTGDATLLYNTGIQESFKVLGLTATDATTYYTASASPLINFTLATTPAAKLEAIGTQKWIALNGINGLEAWTEYRRTGYPSKNPIPVNAAYGNKRPVRLPYPQNEVNGNSANIPSVDYLGTRIFWDVD